MHPTLWVKFLDISLKTKGFTMKSEALKLIGGGETHLELLIGVE